MRAPLPYTRSTDIPAAPPSCSRPGCRNLGGDRRCGSSAGLVECGLPSDAVGDDMQEPLPVGHVVRVTRPDRFPGEVGRVGCRNSEHAGQPGLAVAAVVGERLAGPLAGHQDPPPAVAEMLTAVGFSPTTARPQAWPGGLGVGGLARPAGAGRRAWFLAQRICEPARGRGLGPGAGSVADAGVLWPWLWGGGGA